MLIDIKNYFMQKFINRMLKNKNKDDHFNEIKVM